jgi:ribosome-binding protein aMBF1 (putative translation factor)
MPLKNYTYYNRPVSIPKDYERLVKELIDARSERSLSQEALAHKMGCTTSLIHKWETHKRIPSGFMLMCWLDALEYDIEVKKR